MTPTEAEKPNNPMKKRFRSWQPAEDSPMPRRRRYPQLVVRDGTGHHIAHDIATAPKVELPLTPIVPGVVTVPRHYSFDDEEIQPNLKRENEIGLPAPGSPTGTASTLDRTNHMEGQGAPRSPSSPFYEKSRTANDIRDAQPSADPAYRRASGSSPRAQPAHAPVSGARVNPVLMHSQPDYPADAPSYPARPRTTSNGYAPHNSSSYPLAPASTGQPTGQPYEHDSAPYPARTGHSTAQEQLRQYASSIHNTNPQQTRTYQARPSNYEEPHTGNREPAPERPPSRSTQAEEKVILAGKRCGTVEYWRSSLQMPREKGVIRSLKAPMRYYKKSRHETPEQAQQTQPENNTPPRSTSVPPRASPGHASGYPAALNASDQPQRATYPEDYTPNQSDGEHEYSPRDGEGVGHEFWRSATKLPRANVDTTRIKKLASGKRRLDSNGVPYNELPRDASPSDVPNDLPANTTPATMRQYGTPNQAGYSAARGQNDYVPQAHGSAPGAGQATMLVAQQQANRSPYSSHDGGRAVRGKANSETRRLLFLRDFEMRRLKTNAQGKFHVKMNLRGRTKLENWICSDRVSWEATNVVLSMFNTDRRVLSKNEDVRRIALYNMSNEDLRILEALMSRIQSRGGRQNWEMLITHLAYEDFVRIPMSD